VGAGTGKDLVRAQRLEQRCVAGAQAKGQADDAAYGAGVVERAAVEYAQGNELRCLSDLRSGNRVGADGIEAETTCCQVPAACEPFSIEIKLIRAVQPDL
jgi:hypothetical protein